MKSTVWLIYVSSIVIMLIQAEVQDAENTGICMLCEDSTIPKCENTDNAKLDRQIDCEKNGCVIAEDSHTNFVCVLERESIASSQQTLETEKMQATVLPVPIALQMVTTEATESVKDVNEPADSEDNGNTEVANNVQVEEQHELAEQIETQQEHSDDKNASTEHVKEPQPAEAENNAASAVEAGVEEVTNGQPNADATLVTSAENVAVEQPVAEEAEVLEPDNGAQSPDYAADAPAINEAAENVDVENPTAAAEKPQHTAESEPPSTNDIHEGDGDNDVNKNTLDTNKDEVLINNYNEQTALNGVVTTVMEHNDDSALPANVDEPEITVDNVEPQHTDSTESDNAANAPPAVTVDNIAPPAGTNAFMSCLSCSSTTDAKCAAGPGRAVNCQALGYKQNGCYTLYKADTNVTTRGCISELTNEGLKYCKSNTKQCIICYEQGCNNLLAPSAAIRISSQLSIWLGFVGFMLLTYML